MKAIHTFERASTTLPTARCYIRGALNLQQHRSEKLKFCKMLVFFIGTHYKLKGRERKRSKRIVAKNRNQMKEEEAGEVE
jgi:hypothetical protein